MPAPLIGITVHVQSPEGREPTLLLRSRYVEAVRLAGGLPVLIPLLPPTQASELLGRVQGLLLTGGGRLGRGVLRMRALPSLEDINPRRYAFERALVLDAVRRDLPVLGICRGMQTIAAVLGGRVANLDAQEGGGETITHYQQAPGGRPTHGIEIQRGSHLAAIIDGEEAQVNSFHRQSVADPGHDLAVSARARDGVIEAVEGPGQPFLVGVQFHPEQLLNRDTRWLRLFEMFVRAARRAS